MALPLRDDTPTRHIPWVTFTLILVNVVVFLFLQPASLQGGGSDRNDLSHRQARAVDQFEYRWGVVPCEIARRQPLSSGITCNGLPAGSRPTGHKYVLLSLLTSMFIHGSILHLAGNMLFLWVFGAAVEDRIGPVPYLILYLLTGVIAVLGHAAFHWHDAVPVLGASGAIAGLMGAYLVFRPRGRVLSVILWTVVYVPAWALLGLFFVTQFLTPDSAGVAWEAHAVGMLAGFVFALGLARIFPDPLAPTAAAIAPVGSDPWTLPTGPPAA